MKWERLGLQKTFPLNKETVGGGLELQDHFQYLQKAGITKTCSIDKEKIGGCQNIPYRHGKSSV